MDHHQVAPVDEPGADTASQLQTIKQIALKAGKLLSSYFQSDSLQTAEKGFLDVVTQADTESEKLVVASIRDRYPDDAIVGEEGSNTEGDNGRTWFIDPLDGTFNFSRGLPFWCVSIGLVVEGRPELGVVFDPIRDEMFTSAHGRGAYLNGLPISSSTVTDPMAATLQLTLNYDRHAIDQSIRDFNTVARNVMRLRNMGALALELAYVACGRLDAVCQRGSHPWDYAAAVVVCREAGTVITNVDGSPFDLETDDALVAATPELHSSLRRLLADRAIP